MLKRFLYILLFINSCAMGTFAQDAQWEITGYLPHGFFGAQAAVVDSTIYIIGGVNDSVQTTTNWIYSFDPNTNELRYLNKMKKKRIRFIAGVSDSLIYITGGEFFMQGPPYGLLECYNPFTNTVTSIDSNSRFSRNDAAGLIINNKLYVAGGSMQSSPPGGTTSYLYEYSIPQKAITYNANFFGSGYPREQVITYLNNNIYLMGGSFNTVSKDIFRYNVNTHYFKKELSELVTVRAGGRAVYFTKDSTQVMLIGGHNERDHAMNNVEVYVYTDTTQITSVTMAALNYKRRDFMAVNYGDYIYVFGGRNEYGSFVYAVERYHQPITDVQDYMDVTPVSYTLAQNYPNPFNPSTTIKYSLPVKSNVSIKVYDLLGSEVTELINKEEEAGTHSLIFNGNSLAGGVYFYRINANNYTLSRKMILLK